MKKLLRKCIGLPNIFYNCFVMKYRKIKVGQNLKIQGRIVCISNIKNAICIGDNVKINSSRLSNPIGGDTRTILFAKNHGKIEIGNNVGISNSTIFACESIKIGENVMIVNNTKVYDTDFHWINFDKRINETGAITAPVEIKKGAFIGGHCIILKGVTIGENAVVGAGLVVTKDIPDNEIWAGNPVKFIRKI